METFLQMTPHVRFAAQYRYQGNPAESSRQGNCYALHLFADSNGHVLVNGVRYPVEKGTLLFIRPGQLHGFHFTPASSSLSYNIYFDLWIPQPEGLSFPHFSYHPDPIPPNLMSPQRACEPLDSLPTCVLMKNLALEELFVQINKSYYFPVEAGYRDKWLGSMMTSWLMQWYLSHRHAPPSDPRILRVMEELERSPETPMSYEQMCRICGLEKSYYYKLFKRETGMTPKDYLLKIKMKKAGSMLLESNRSITFIAEELGYDSIHYFSKQFAAFHGIPPSAFRRKSTK